MSTKLHPSKWGWLNGLNGGIIRSRDKPLVSKYFLTVSPTIILDPPLPLVD